MYRRYCVELGYPRNQSQLALVRSKRVIPTTGASPCDVTDLNTSHVTSTPNSFRGNPEPSQPQPESQDGVVASLLAGDVTRDCPSSDKIVRIFLSSTFTDTRHERNTLMERVYPRLRAWCQRLGYEFQVVDMRWGVRDEATDDHRTTDLCLTEIDHCNHLSTGPCFVTFTSHKYGYRSFPRKFDQEEFQTLLRSVSSEPNKQLLIKWFKLDENAVPLTHVLQPISSQLPEYRSRESEARGRAADQWWREMEAMLDAIGRAAPSCLSTQRAHALVQSVTESEIRHGMLAHPSLSERSLWFYRHVEDIDTVPPSTLAGRYKDCKYSPEKNEESHRLLEDLKEEMTSFLPPGHVHKYNVKWDPDGGMDPEKNPTHRQYISDLCRDFERELQRLTRRAIDAREAKRRVTPLVEEVTQHARFCREKCRSFSGRLDALERTTAYLKSGSRRAMVIHGESGSGKTSIMAMAATQAWALQRGTGMVIVRFLGTTAESSTLSSLVSSILQQLLTAGRTQRQPDSLPSALGELVDMLHAVLRETARADFPVTLILDSLDQLHPESDARKVAWLPSDLQPGVKVVVSTLPEAQYEALPALKAIYQDDMSNFYEVPTLADDDVSGILDQWLRVAQRRLTANQRAVFLAAFASCPLPLYLKLSFDAACRWRSYMPAQSTQLQGTVRDSIDVLFAGLEVKHGHTLVSRALGYLTISQNGLTETELEDILSCDDDVLNDVYTYWTPPVRRLPPLLLARLRADLGQYMVERGVDGVGVFYWYHRQFIEAARDRYCHCDTARLRMHTNMMHFFCGTWAQGRAKPYTDKTGNSKQADRMVAAQPLKFGDSTFNLRKLNNLPYHAIMAGRHDMIKRECLFNFRFLLTKLLACGIRSVMDDFRLAKERLQLEHDADFTMMAETLQLSQDALHTNPRELPAQILSRIVEPESQDLQQLLVQCRDSDHVYVMPNSQVMERPGGQLVHCLKERIAEIAFLAMTLDGRTIVTSSRRQKVLDVFDVREGRHVRKMGLAVRPMSVHLCCNDALVVTASMLNFNAYWLATGLPSWKVSVEESRFGIKTRVCFVGPGRHHMALISLCDLDLYCAKSGARAGRVPKPMHVVRKSFVLRKFNEGQEPDTLCTGSEHHVVMTEIGRTSLLVIDIKEQKHVAFRRFHQNEDEDELSSDEDDDDDDGDPERRHEELDRLRLHLKERRQMDPKNYAPERTEGETFVIEDLLISPDGKHVLCIPRHRKELHVLNVLTLDTVRVISGSSGDFATSLQMTPDGRYVFFPRRNAVRVCDVETGKMASILTQSEKVNVVTTVDMRTVITVASDNAVKIWDLRRGLPAGETTALHFRSASPVSGDGEEKEQASGEANTQNVKAARHETAMTIMTMSSLSNPRYVMLKTSCTRNHRYLQVYDVTEDRVVRQADLGNADEFPDYEMLKYLVHVTETHVLACADGMLQMIDLDTMKVVRTFHCYMRQWVPYSTVLINQKADILTLSRHRHHLKIYNVASGKTTVVIKPRSKKLDLLSYIQVNAEGTVAVTGTDHHRSLLVFDLRAATHLYSLQAAELHQPDLTLNGQVALEPSGRYMVLGGQIPIELTHVKLKKGIKLHGILVYDIQQREVVRYLYDMTARNIGWKYQVVVMLDGDRVLSTCLDTTVRVHNIHTGEELWRMEARVSAPYPYMEPGCELLLLSVFHRGNFFSIYRLPDLTFVATFSLDHKLARYQLLPGVKDRFLAVHPYYPLPVIFSLHGAETESQDTPSTVAPLFPGLALSHTLKLCGPEAASVDVDYDPEMDDDITP